MIILESILGLGDLYNKKIQIVLDGMNKKNRKGTN